MNTACSRGTCLLDTAVSKTFRTTKEKSPRCKEVPFKWTWQNITNIPAHLMRNITSFVIPLINPAFVCLLQPFNPSIDDDSKGVFIWTPALLCYEDVSMASHSTMGCQLKHLGAQKKKIQLSEMIQNLFPKLENFLKLPYMVLCCDVSLYLNLRTSHRTIVFPVRCQWVNPQNHQNWLS